MTKEQKNILLSKATRHIFEVQNKITETIAAKEAGNLVMSKESIRLSSEDVMVQRKILAIKRENVENLRRLRPSPYFNLCEFVVNGEKKTLYFSKFSFNEENIYSWITPAASLRFEKPGATGYRRPNGEKIEGFLARKDQYMIVDGKLIFFSTEEAGKNRELIHQEHFTKHKQGFVLPEVVEQMEKAQDQVIRAHYQDPFLISGPAGSGKTTLALHRIAYLLQSPETAEYFSPNSILVMVQDAGTKEYFSHLLPDLGIKGVSIVTFEEWAFSILELQGYTYNSYTDLEDPKRFAYEHAKISAMREKVQRPLKKNAFSMLGEIYDSMDKKQKIIFERQKKEKSLDRFDLTILLQIHLKERGHLFLTKEYYKETKNSTYQKRKGLFPAQYDLAVIDEFQNYLPEQISLLKSSLNRYLNSIIYVGDIAQQTMLGTVKDLENIGERLSAERMVTLQKVYRNTKQILNFIKNLGYKISIPAEIKDGAQVNEQQFISAKEEIQYIKNRILKLPNTSVGILCKERSYLAEFKTEFKNLNVVHCLDFHEAQGVEFDQVFIVGLNKNSFLLSDVPSVIYEETKKIYRDILYVALTRAMSELHILGRDKLEKCTKNALF